MHQIGKFSFDVGDDFRILLSRIGFDEHMQMIGQNDDSVKFISVMLFRIGKGLTKQVDIFDEDFLSSVGNDGNEICMTLRVNSSIIGHGGV